MAETVCPRCGFKNSFIKGFLPNTCVCKVCQSQLDWREIPGCGPDCKAADPETAGPQTADPQAAGPGWSATAAPGNQAAGADDPCAPAGRA